MNKSNNSLNWYRKNRLSTILQNENSECALACLAMIANYYGGKTNIGVLRRRHPITALGTSLRGVIDIASEMGFKSRPLKFELWNLANLQLPCILHWDLNHFVVLKKVSKKGVTVLDPAIGEKLYSESEASKHITGVALELSPSQTYDTKRHEYEEPEKKLRIRDFWTSVTGLKRALLQTLLLSVILQLFVIVSPLFMQLAIDEVVVKQDSDLLLVLFVGFSFLHVINLISATLRSYVLLHLGSLLSFQIVGNLFRHMIRLPMSYFEKRHVGDILSRFQSSSPLQKLLTEDLVAGIMDGVMATTTLIMMFIYSPLLTWVVVAALTFYIVVSFSLLPLYRERTKETILASAKENSNFIETLRAMQPIRLFAGENDRDNVWQKYYADVINSTIRLGHVGITYGFFRGLVTSIETVLVIYLGVKSVLNAELSVGMIFAFVAWKGQFSDRVLSLVQKGLDLKMLGLHLERLSDIVQTKKEPFFELPVNKKQKLKGELEASNLTFSYGPAIPPILNGISLHVAPGEMVAITGPSGCGKTTLMKLFAGLLEPTEGGILVDGKKLNALGVQNYRTQIATVMQDDQLLSGSILDNICFFDDEPDFDHIEDCAKAACVHKEIMAMPMKYQSLIGDMGVFLSGGQKQRVVLARALYRRPKILLIDEGTSHVDVAMENDINENLKSMEMTRMIVAHRPATIDSASKVFLLANGTLLPCQN